MLEIKQEANTVITLMALAERRVKIVYLTNHEERFFHMRAISKMTQVGATDIISQEWYHGIMG